MPKLLAAPALAVLVAIGAATALASGSAARTSFADGRWTGSSKLSQSIEGILLKGTGAFTIEIKRGRVVSGTLVVTGTASGSSEGKKASAAITGRFPLSGPAKAPTGRGNLVVSAKVDGKTEKATAAVVNVLSALSGTCDRMRGKIVLKPQKVDPGSGPSSIDAPFTATRTSGSGPAC